MTRMSSTGIRDLKNNLSHYVRQIEAGKRIAVTANGRVVAELVPPSGGARPGGVRRYDELVGSGVIELAVEPDTPLPSWPEIGAPVGTVADLIASDRGDA
jgi:prevent-host-death family protein